MKMSAHDRIRQRLTFCGQVQGVGFRYRAKYAAAELGLTGWVENMYDGTVVAEVQGNAGQIEELIRTLSEGRWIRVDHVIREHMPVVPGEKSFRVHNAW